MKRWKRMILAGCLVSATSVIGAGPVQAITCTITDPNATGTEVSVKRGANSTTVTVEPGPATLPQATCV